MAGAFEDSFEHRRPLTSSAGTMGDGGPSSARIRAEIDAVFATDRDLGEVVEDVARLGARLLVQTALEAAVTGSSARERYARSHFRFHDGARLLSCSRIYGRMGAGAR